MDGDEIRNAEKILLGDIVRACGLRFLLGEVLAPGDCPHAEGLADRGGSLAQLAKTKNAEGKPFEVAPDGHLPGRSRFQSRIFQTDAARELQHQPEDDPGRGTADGASPANRNAAFGAGLDVEGIIACPGRDQQL